jgi:polysaccharide biosynthesis/export protein
MKLYRRLFGLGSVVSSSVLLAVLLSSGCATKREPVVFPSDPTVTNTPAGTTSQSAVPEATRQPGVLDIGDEVIVIYSDPALQPHDERIKEDGTVTLQLVGTVKAAGKTPGQLQKELQALYVPKYYQPGRLTVTVKTQDQYFYVGGEVRSQGAKVYPGAMTVTKAIQTAGDFTDFANKKKIRLTRADGTTITVNWKKANQDPNLDPPVFPGDRIQVPRTLW